MSCHYLYDNCCHMTALLLSHDCSAAVAWLHCCCHMTALLLSHDCTATVTWLHCCCHMTAVLLSHDCTAAVTWLHCCCHMTARLLSHDCTAAVTRLHGCCHMTALLLSGGAAERALAWRDSCGQQQWPAVAGQHHCQDQGHSGTWQLWTASLSRPGTLRWVTAVDSNSGWTASLSRPGTVTS